MGGDTLRLARVHLRSTGDPALKTKPVLHLPIDLSGIEVVSAAKGEAITQQKVAVGAVQRIEGEGPSFAETLAEREVEGRVLREPCRSAIIREAGSIVEVSTCPTAPGKIHISARAERVLLVVVQKESIRRRGEVGQPTGHSTPPLRPLV